MWGVKEEILEEWFDVVDVLDRPIRRERRVVVHDRALFHRAVHVMVLDSKERLIVQKRSASKDVAPGKWCSSCSGHVDAGEDYLAAAVRELGEEIGLRVKPKDLKPVLWASACEETGREFVWVYLLRHEGPFHFDEKEVSALEKLSLEELAKRSKESPETFSPSFLHLYHLFALLPPERRGRP